jgi:hypothetical protein
VPEDSIVTIFRSRKIGWLMCPRENLSMWVLILVIVGHLQNQGTEVVKRVRLQKPAKLDQMVRAAKMTASPPHEGGAAGSNNTSDDDAEDVVVVRTTARIASNTTTSRRDDGSTKNGGTNQLTGMKVTAGPSASNTGGAASGVDEVSMLRDSISVQVNWESSINTLVEERMKELQESGRDQIADGISVVSSVLQKECFQNSSSFSNWSNWGRFSS